MRIRNQLSITMSAFAIVIALVSACGPKAAPTPSGNASRPVSAPTTAPPAAANSNPPGSNANAAGRDPCSLLTKDEASQLLAQPVTDVKTEFGTCFYSAANQTRVGVQPFWSGGVALLKSDLAMFPDAQPVPGLGDEALYSTDGRLEVRKGDAAFVIASTIPVTPNKLDKLKTAAAKIVSRFP
jgi:hypothetical protein